MFTTKPLLLFPLLFGVFALKPVFLLFELALACFLPLFFFKVANEALSRDLLAFVALPNSLWHPLEVCAEQVVRLITGAAIDEIARVLALEAVVWVLNHQ